MIYPGFLGAVIMGEASVDGDETPHGRRSVVGWNFRDFLVIPVKWAPAGSDGTCTTGRERWSTRCNVVRMEDTMRHFPQIYYGNGIASCTSKSPLRRWFDSLNMSNTEERLFGIVGPLEPSTKLCHACIL